MVSDQPQVPSENCVFDLFLDIPHPVASPSKERAEIIGPPTSEKPRPEIAALYEPRSILQIERFAFPDYDPETGKISLLDQPMKV